MKDLGEGGEGQSESSFLYFFLKFIFYREGEALFFGHVQY